MTCTTWTFFEKKYLTVSSQCSVQDLLSPLQHVGSFLSCNMWDLVPSSGVKPGLPAWELAVLAPGPPRKFQRGPFHGWLLSLNIMSGRLIVQLHVIVILSYFPTVF